MALEAAGATTAAVGLVGQPEINPVADGAVGVGVGMMGLGGVGGAFATGLQVAGGIAQMIGGNESVGATNAYMGAVSLIAGAFVGKFGQIVTAPPVSAGTTTAMAYAGVGVDAANQVAGKSPGQAGCGQ